MTSCTKDPKFFSCMLQSLMQLEELGFKKAREDDLRVMHYFLIKAVQKPALDVLTQTQAIKQPN